MTNGEASLWAAIREIEAKQNGREMQLAQLMNAVTTCETAQRTGTGDSIEAALLKMAQRCKEGEGRMEALEKANRERRDDSRVRRRDVMQAIGTGMGLLMGALALWKATHGG